MKFEPIVAANFDFDIGLPYFHLVVKRLCWPLLVEGGTTFPHKERCLRVEIVLCEDIPYNDWFEKMLTETFTGVLTCMDRKGAEKLIVTFHNMKLVERGFDLDYTNLGPLRARLVFRYDHIEEKLLPPTEVITTI